MALVAERISKLGNSLLRSPASVSSTIQSPSSVFSSTRTGRTGTRSSRASSYESPRNTSASTNPSRMSHTSSRTWVSEKSRETQQWNAILSQLRRMYPDQAQVPWTFGEWVRHRQTTVEVNLRSAARRIAIETEKNSRLDPSPQPLAFGGKVFTDGRSSVLAAHTMWCPSFLYHLAYRYGGVIWPSQEEMAFEGNDRAKTGYGRFLPLVRDWSVENETVNFKLMHELLFFDFDKVWQPPTMEDIYLPVDEIDDGEIPRLLNKDVMAALDDDDIL